MAAPPPLIARAEGHAGRVAVIDDAGSFTYRQLLDASGRVAARLAAGAPDLAEARVAFLVPPEFSYVAVQWGIWRSGGIAVPLCLSHPRPELDYVVGDADAEILIAAPDLAERLRPIAAARDLRLLTTPELLAPAAAAGESLPAIGPSRRAMIVYTSGTTSRPKGVVTTHGGLEAQITSLVIAWEWHPDDRILHVLPLHHVHGIVNALACALWSGAACEMLPRFDAAEVWHRFERGGLTLFMAVPTVYARLLAAWEAEPPGRRRALAAAAARLRLMVSGSAALPVSLFEGWRQATGHTLLERYGMTEIGMALSNPLQGPRIPGSVGTPLPGVEVRRVAEDGRVLGASEGATPGEIEVRGPGVFREYWRRPGATAEAFRDGDWFKTGDVAVVEKGVYRILGRQSVDIIKSGGYKISALEIEEVLRTHPAVADGAVVGVPDPEWGERVAAALVLARGADLDLETLRAWGKERLAAYKVPTRLLCIDELPRNALGKVTKPAVKRLFGA